MNAIAQDLIQTEMSLGAHNYKPIDVVLSRGSLRVDSMADHPEHGERAKAASIPPLRSATGNP